MKQNQQLEGETDSETIKIGNFNIPLLVINSTTKQKIYKEIEIL